MVIAAGAVIGLLTAIIIAVVARLPAPHLRWAYTTGAAVRSGPAVAGGTVYVGSLRS